MCHMFYLAADRALPTVEQHVDFPDFEVTTNVGEAGLHIRTLIAAPFLYYVASWQGCSCGFCYEDRAVLEHTLAEIPDEAVRRTCREGWQRGYNSVHSLARYLQAQVEHGPISLYIAWAGREGVPIQHQQRITPEYFGGSAFELLSEDSLLTIVPERDQPTTPVDRKR
jgi:hypothetical protein